MIVYKLGGLIKAARESRCISQENLAQDVCSTQTLSRLENGKSMVGREKYLKLLERLGVKEDPAGAFAGSGYGAFETRRRFERAVIEENSAEAKVNLDHLMKLDSRADQTSKQYLRNAQKLLAFRSGELSAMDYAAFIRETYENVDRAFQNGSVNVAALTHPEQFMLVELATALHRSGASLQALTLLESLRYSVSRTYLCNPNHMNPLVLSLTVSARILYDLKRYREAAVTCDDMLNMCRSGSFNIPEVLMIKALSIEASEGGHYLANEVEAMKRKAYYLALAVGNDRVSEQLRVS